MSKDDALIAAIGDVDEANSALGVALVQLEAGELRDALTQVQNELFDLGADLATPWNPDAPGPHDLRVTDGQVERIETLIDALNAGMPPLTSFILPGGSAVASSMHLARAIARRAERSCVRAAEERALNPVVLRYINRLSDLLFVVARHLNQNAGTDVLWVPGASR